MGIRLLPAGWIRGFFAMALMMAAATATANAGTMKSWKIDITSSEIKFVASKFKEPFTGSFESFKVDIAYDSEVPDSSHFKVEIDTSSVKTGIAKVNELLQKSAWFASETHPLAVFEATGLQQIDDDKYALEGLFTLKGQSKKMALEVDVKMADDLNDAGRLVVRASSEFTIKRLAFLVGTGVWADTGAIADEVKVQFILSAFHPKPVTQ